MIKSNRTKRRKIKECLDMINNSTTNVPSISNSFDSILVSHSSSLLEPIISDKLSVESITSNSNNSDLLINNTITTLVEPTETLPTEFTFNNKIAHWSVQYKIPLNAVNGLLSVLRSHKCFLDMPKDSRTLLGTFKNLNYSLRKVEPGIYYHFGIAKGILKNYISSYGTNDDLIKIAVGFDGLPLSRSSKSQFWPILAYNRNVNISKVNVFPIGIYHGDCKPHDSDDFILDFVNEAIDLTTNGLDIDNKHFKIIFDLFCCDVPAKSFILKIKGHSGFFSCTRCIIEGEYINSRVCFPYCHTMSSLRSDHEYRNVTHEEFHTSLSPSIITQIPHLDITKSFILDYMHLTNLGIMRKMISFWILKGPSNVRLPGRMVNEITSRLLNIKQSIPKEFGRKPREIQGFLQWKASEFRLFLVYLGPFVLKNILSINCYTNFMSLNVAMIILLSPNKRNYSEYAHELLHYFVKSFDKIYGNFNVSHNVHGLLHLTTDYLNFGPLDNSSCYPFENYMKTLKSVLRKHEKPLQQFIRRYEEQCSLLTKVHNSEKLNLNNTYYIFKKTHTKGFLPKDLTGPQYKQLYFNNFFLNTSVDRDSYILTDCNKIVKCINFANKHINNKIIQVFIGNYFINKMPAYINPLSSTLLNIYKVENLSRNVIVLDVNKIKCKMMIINVNNETIAIPILHSDL